jgi:hypothetical protein
MDYNNMTCSDRLTTPHNPAFGVQQFTPTQQFFIETNARGRWSDDILTSTNANANYMKVFEDGTVDVIALQNGNNCWYDMGGKGAHDVRAGRF